MRWLGSSRRTPDTAQKEQNGSGANEGRASERLASSVGLCQLPMRAALHACTPVSTHGVVPCTLSLSGTPTNPAGTRTATETRESHHLRHAPGLSPRVEARAVQLLQAVHQVRAQIEALRQLLHAHRRHRGARLTHACEQSAQAVGIGCTAALRVLCALHPESHRELTGCYDSAAIQVRSPRKPPFGIAGAMLVPS